MGCNALFAAVPPAIRPDAKIETRIEKILGRLTLEEKIGQMCQLTVSMEKQRDLLNIMVSLSMGHHNY